MKVINFNLQGRALLVALRGGVRAVDVPYPPASAKGTVHPHLNFTEKRKLFAFWVFIFLPIYVTIDSVYGFAVPRGGSGTVLRKDR